MKELGAASSPNNRMPATFDQWGKKMSVRRWKPDPTSSTGDFGVILPAFKTLDDGTLIRIDVINPSQCDVALSLLNESWQDGDDLGYQSVEEMLTILKPKHILAAFNDSDANILGIFFLSSNFPSRSSHICEGVIITRDLYRRRGVGAFMGLVLLEIAKSSGYTLVFQGLVFVNNSAAVALCRKLGMKLLSILPRAGLLRAGRQYTDAMQFYFSFHPNPGTTATTDASEYHDPDDEIWMMEALKLAQKAEEEVQFISYALSFL